MPIWNNTSCPLPAPQSCPSFVLEGLLLFLFLWECRGSCCMGQRGAHPEAVSWAQQAHIQVLVSSWIRAPELRGSPWLGCFGLQAVLYWPEYCKQMGSRVVGRAVCAEISGLCQGHEHDEMWRNGQAGLATAFVFMPLDARDTKLRTYMYVVPAVCTSFLGLPGNPGKLPGFGYYPPKYVVFMYTYKNDQSGVIVWEAEIQKGNYSSAWCADGILKAPWICSRAKAACSGWWSCKLERIQQPWSWPGLSLLRGGVVVGLPQMLLCLPSDCKWVLVIKLV